MKKLFSLVGLMLFSIASFADVTTNHPTISEVTINPGGEVVTISVSVENIQKYCAYGMDIYLPEGYEFIQKEFENADEEMEWMYAAKGAAGKSTHYPKSKIQANGALRVATMSTAKFKTSSNEIFTFFVKANSWVKTGNPTIYIKDCSFTMPDNSEDQAEDQTISDKVTVSTSCTLPIAAGWSTCVFPFTPASLPAGVKVYDVESLSATSAVLKEATTIGDYKPYVVNAEAAQSLAGTITAAYPAGATANGALNGVVTATEITSGYVLQTQDKTGFYKVNAAKAITVPMGKCYLTTSSGAKIDMYDLELQTTAIKTVNAAADNDAVYDLNGLKVVTPRRGVYIKGGKKVVMK